MTRLRRHLIAFAVALALLPASAFAAPANDALIKGSGDAVYYHADGKRYVFPDARTYASWFGDFSGIDTVSDAELAAIPLGGNVTHRPGIRMVKIQTDPKVYAVDLHGTLRWVTSEDIAETLYGQYWGTFIDDVSDAFFVNYTVGDPIDVAEEFSPAAAAASATTINADKGIPSGPSPRVSDTQVGSVEEGWRAAALADINAIRAEHGKSALTRHPLLDRVATIHSRDMALHLHKLAHEGSLGETSHDRIRLGKVPNADGTAFMTVAHPENIGWSAENVGYATRRSTEPIDSAVRRLHRLFLNEPADEQNHRTTMLSTFQPYSVIGIGIYVDGQGTVWLTEDFITVQ